MPNTIILFYIIFLCASYPFLCSLDSSHHILASSLLLPCFSCSLRNLRNPDFLSLHRVPLCFLQNLAIYNMFTIWWLPVIYPQYLFWGSWPTFYFCKSIAFWSVVFINLHLFPVFFQKQKHFLLQIHTKRPLRNWTETQPGTRIPDFQ